MFQSKNVVQTDLSGYTVRRHDDLGLCEHFINMGIGGKAYLSPLEHLGVLTWFQLIRQTGDEIPLLLPNETDGQLTWLAIRVWNINDHDLLKMLTGGYKVEPEELKYYLRDNHSNEMVTYHDIAPTIRWGRFEDLPVWVFEPTIQNSSGAIVLKPDELGKPQRPMLGR